MSYKWYKLTSNLVPRAFPSHFFEGKALGTRLIDVDTFILVACKAGLCLAGKSHLWWRFQRVGNVCRAYAESEKVLAMKGNTLVDSQERACARTIFTVGRVGRKLL